MAKNKKGMGTVEVVIIIAILVALALIFREGLMDYGDKERSLRAIRDLENG